MSRTSISRNASAIEAIRHQVLAVEAGASQSSLDSDFLRCRGTLLYRTRSLDHAGTIWRPAMYDLVIVDKNFGAGRVLEFCRKLKDRYPEQRIALIVDHALGRKSFPEFDAIFVRTGQDVSEQVVGLLNAE